MASISLKGSERVAMAGARVLAPADPNERLEVSLIVRCRARQEFRGLVSEVASGQAAEACLSRQEFAQRHGADPADLAAVRAFASSCGLTVVQEHAARRRILFHRA